MTETNAIAIYSQFDQMQRAALALHRSGYFTDAKSEAQAVVKVMAGAELGLPPFASMAGINIIHGKPALGANVIATLVKNDPRYNYNPKIHDNEQCVIEWYENGNKTGESSFTMADAKIAGLTGKDGWKKFPSDMLFARAITRGSRRFAPGIFGGSPIYTPEELGAEVDEDGDIVEAPIVEVTTPEPENQSKPDPTPESTNGTRPYSPDKVREKIQERAKKHKQFEPSDKQRNLLRYGLELCFLEDPEAEDKRHTVLNYLTGSTSTNDTDGQYFKAIIEDWLVMKSAGDGSGEYDIDKMAAMEAKEIYVAALKEEGQQELEF
jgi:hypothetical protein